MEDIDFNWGSDTKGLSYKLKQKDAQRQCALQLLDFIKEKAQDKKSAMIKQSDINKLVKCKAANAWEAKPDPVECAKELGLIEVDWSTRPYTYTVIDNEDSIPFTLRPYQEEIINQTTKARGSVLIEAPTGSGKSVIASKVALNETKKGGKVLIVAPKVILLEQLRDTFANLNPQIIHGPKDYDTEHNVFISTLQTAHKRELGFEPSMILIDEVHHGFSGKMIKQLLSNFNGRLIGLSATPYDQNGLHLDGFDLHLDQFDVKYMLENGYLVPTVSYAPVKVELKGISLVAGDYSQSELDKEFNTYSNILQIVKHTKDKIASSKAALVFCINIEHAEAIAKVYNEHGINTKAIHSNLTKNEQNEIMQSYKNGEIKLLANPMLLTTGFDYPTTDCIVLARATKSQNLYKQMVGRGMRLSKDKTHLTLLDCAGVIEDLGLPTEPIKPNMKLGTTTKTKCNNCESERLYRKIQNDRTYMICADCSHKELVEQNSIECSNCGVIYGKHSKHITKNNELYLVCITCENETLVSSSSSEQEMQKIFDRSYVEILQKRITLLVLEEYMEKISPSFILNQEVNEHLKALQVYVSQNPDLFVGVEIDDIAWLDEFRESRKKDPHCSEYMFSINKDESWRLFNKELQDSILYANISELKKLLENSPSIKESFRVINAILEEKGEETLDRYFAERIESELKKSSTEGIERITNKRLKDLFLAGKDLNELNGFISMMESVL
jgi:superfamily II DNA or RNA helicase